MRAGRRDDPTGLESQLVSLRKRCAAAALSLTSAQIAEALEGEQANFLSFARKTAEEVAPEPLFFSDLVPAADSMVRTARAARPDCC